MSNSSKCSKWKPIAYLVIATTMLVFSVVFLLWSIGYMERGRVATSLIAALSGFTLLTGSLYVFRLSAYSYAVEKGE
ncbi:MAG: hypothetical protein QXO48_06140 [Desulfurococcaceae archaeon]